MKGKSKWQFKETHVDTAPVLIMMKPECSSCEWRKEHKQYLQSKRQFIPGEPITDLNTLSEQEWVLWYGCTKHIEVIKSMTLRTVLMFLKKGAFCKAIKREKEN